MWYLWDSAHYTRLAQDYSFSLSKLQPNVERDGKFQYHLLSWFPLYPIAGRTMHEVTRISIPLSLIIISNISFLVALYFFYRLVRIDHSEKFSRLAIAILFLLPTSFIFSSALSEALFLLLAVLTMYFARRGLWLTAGLTAIALALTRSVGFIICIPLAVEALQQYGIPQKTNWRPFIRPFIACILAVLGLVLFMAYCWVRTGNAFAYTDSEYAFWGITFHNPLTYILTTLSQLKTILILVEMALLVILWRTVRLSLVIYGILFALAAVTPGSYFAAMSELRYTAILFPVAIAIAALAEKPQLTPYVWATLGIVQGMLFIMWVNWWTVYIV